MCKDPLLNEPGVDKSNPDMNSYDEIIQIANLDIAICSILQKKDGIFLPFFENFFPYVKENFLKNFDKLLQFAEKKNGEFNEEERNLLNEKWWWNYDKCGCENTTMMPDGNAVTYKSCCGSSGAPCSSRWDCPRPKKGGQLMDLTSLSKNI